MRESTFFSITAICMMVMLGSLAVGNVEMTLIPIVVIVVSLFMGHKQ